MVWVSGVRCRVSGVGCKGVWEITGELPRALHRAREPDMCPHVHPHPRRRAQYISVFKVQDVGGKV